MPFSTTPLTRPENRFRSRRLATAAAAAGVASVSSTEAAATIIFDISSSHTTNDVFTLDGTGFSAIEIVLAVGMMGQTSLSLDSNDSAMMGDNSTVEFAFFQPGGGGPRFLEQISSTTDIGAPASPLTFNQEAFLIRNDQVNPSWAVGETAYVGFTFQAGGATTQYGWLQLTFDDMNNATVSQWAYQNDGSPITVGVIPEPSTAVLVGLGLALLGGAGVRRRRTISSALDD